MHILVTPKFCTMCVNPMDNALANTRQIDRKKRLNKVVPKVADGLH